MPSLVYVSTSSLTSGALDIGLGCVFVSLWLDSNTPAIPARARVVHQAEGQAYYFFVEEANRMEAYILERSIAGGRECSKLEGLHYWPPNHN